MLYLGFLLTRHIWVVPRIHVFLDATRCQPVKSDFAVVCFELAVVKRVLFFRNL